MALSERVRSTPTGSGHAEVGGFPCACSAQAIVEKAGRTVCRTCADGLPGREFPLRRGWQRAGAPELTERRQLGMIEGRNVSLYPPPSGYFG